MKRSSSQPAARLTQSSWKGRTLLEHNEAYKCTVHAPYRFTMRCKTKFGDEMTYLPQGGELSGPLAEQLDAIRNKPPSYSMLARASGITKPPDQPGPGHYPMPSTLYGSHPTLPMAGRVPVRTARRSEPKDQLMQGDTPSPQDYAVVTDKKFGRYDQVTAPTFTMRAKIKDPADKEKRPGCQAYTLGNVSNKGKMDTPSWSMTTRGSGITKPPDFPGPGDYAVPSTIYGVHPSLTCPGRVPHRTTRRFKKESEIDDRPY